MKYISFSFDDGRRDAYTNAYTLFKKFGCSFTVNVVTDFVENPSKYTNFASGNNQPMTVENILECQENGIEIACHGHTHKNTAADIIENIRHLSEMGVRTDGIGFASPNSLLSIRNRNDEGIWDLVENGTVSYVRSGIEVRREGLFYTGLALLEKYTHSKALFCKLNKRNIFTADGGRFLSSVTVKSYTGVGQIKALVNAMKDGDKLVLMMHSIARKDDPGYGVDNYYWDYDKAAELLEYFCGRDDIRVMTTREMIEV